MGEQHIGHNGEQHSRNSPQTFNVPTPHPILAELACFPVMSSKCWPNSHKMERSLSGSEGLTRTTEALLERVLKKKKSLLAFIPK
jgi:hypothetical protein